MDQIRKQRKAFQLKFLHKFWLSGIPPAAAGGSFNPGLQDAKNVLESHRRQPVDGSIPAHASNNGKQRLGLNDPPAAAGGIPENLSCPQYPGTERSTGCRRWDFGEHNLCRNFSWNALRHALRSVPVQTNVA